MIKGSLIRLMAVSSIALVFLASCHENQSSDEPQQFDPQVDAIAAAPLPAVDPSLASNVSLLSEPIEIKTSEQLEAAPSVSEKAKIEETPEAASVDSSAETGETKDEDLPDNEKE